MPFRMTQEIMNAWKNREFFVIVVTGYTGVGKTSYGLNIESEVYGKWESDEEVIPTFSWKKLREYLMFRPDEIYKMLRYLRDNNITIPLVIWDDAGYWLHSLDWYHPFVKAVSKFMSLARTCLGCMMLTTPKMDWIVSKVRGLPQTYRVNITKAAGGTVNSPYRMWKRVATTYQQYRDIIGRKRVVVKWRENFSCRLPDSIYKQYKPFRDKYVDMALKQLNKELQSLPELKSIA